ncbi:MAG: dipeptidase [Kangiellaceae bacterium]|nr:dipeptidase [Kangiellaceae bacterium]
MSFLTRRKFLIGGSITLAATGSYGWYAFNKKAPIGFEVDPETIALGRNFLSNNLSIDIHAHPGRSFVEDAENLSTKLSLYAAMGSFEEDTVAKMLAGGLTMSSFSTVADFQLLDLSDKGLKSVREFNKGEAWASYQAQLKTLKELLKHPLISQIFTPEDIIKTKEANKVGAFFTTEGADFLEGNLDRLEQVYSDGFRSLTLVHYHINEIGDIQTEPPRYKGLTRFGIDLVKAMNKKGMLIDLAHAAKETSMKAMEITDKPVMISHSAIRHPDFDSYRFIDLEEGKMVAETGGIIGAWPAGFGLATLADYIDQIFRLVDDVGIDHVALGTALDANYKPVFDDYELTPLLVGSLLKKGMSEEETAKFIGGNFMRVFMEVTG